MADLPEGSVLMPLASRVLVEPLEPEEKTQGGVIIPDNAKEKPMKAKVLACGSEVRTLKPGYMILHGKFAGMEVRIDDKKLLIMPEEDVLAYVAQDPGQKPVKARPAKSPRR